MKQGFPEAGWKIWCISVADKFGDNGITGCVMVNGIEIDTFLLSCRILGKGIEFAFAKKVMSLLKGSGVSMLTAKYLPTAKNAQVKDFYERCGFVCVAEQEGGDKLYKCELTSTDLTIKDLYHIIVK